jgi:hypothetical protein
MSPGISPGGSPTPNRLPGQRPAFELHDERPLQVPGATGSVLLDYTYQTHPAGGGPSPARGPTRGGAESDEHEAHRWGQIR